jgi:hypothetical protein
MGSGWKKEPFNIQNRASKGKNAGNGIEMLTSRYGVQFASVLRYFFVSRLKKVVTFLVAAIGSRAATDFDRFEGVRNVFGHLEPESSTRGPILP